MEDIPKTRCPGCGLKEAVLLLTYHCPNTKCRFWSPICPDCGGKLDLADTTYTCIDCGYCCS